MNSKRVLLKVLCLLIMVLVASNLAHAQSKVLLVKGTVTDEQTGKPIGAELMFTSSKGKKIPAKVSSNDGTFQLILIPNETYTVSAKNYIVPPDMTPFTTPNISEYTEYTKDFRIKKIATGLELYTFNAFNPNDSALIITKLQPFEELKVFLQNNLKVQVQIAVSTGDSYFKPGKRTVQVKEKKKVKNKAVTITTEEQLEKLVNSRINAIKDYFASIKLPDRNVTFKPEIIAGKHSATEPAAKSSKKKGKAQPQETAGTALSSNNTIKITVSKIIDFN